MTEDEAKTKWCPFVRIARLEPLPDQSDVYVHVGGVNTDALGRNRIPRSCLCIASACMAWRWTAAQGIRVERYELDGSVSDVTPTNGHGFCGLAGKP